MNRLLVVCGVLLFAAVVPTSEALGASANIHDRLPQSKAVKRAPRAAFPKIQDNWNFLAPRLGDGGRYTCAICTLIVALVEQSAQIHNRTVDKEVEIICQLFSDNSTRQQCDNFFNEFGPVIIKLLEDEATADEVCNVITLCSPVDGKMCRLFPKPHLKAPEAEEVRIQRMRSKVQAETLEKLRSFNICAILPEVCLVEDHLPAFDDDGDYFSTYDTLRGTYWRGKDCDDSDSTVRPGRDSSDALIDGNCNGIFGTDVDGTPYEDLWCKNTGAMGVAILGDSATAHFRIPPGWVTAADLSWGDFAGVPRDIADELDWPMFSWSTGHLNTTQFEPDISGPVDSAYLQLKRLNLCNNNDYQNLGVNGAASHNLPHFVRLVGRVNQAEGNGNAVPNKPLLLIMAMIGNDVCGSTHGFESMTTPQAYRESVREAVLAADSVLAPGSKIVLVGLVDGRILWDAMHDRIHPIGSTNNDVTYKDLYEYLNCLHSSPCWGWMNANETVRNMTSEHAALLSDQLYVVQNETAPLLNNSQVLVLNNWIEAIKNAPYPHWQLIEPVDGFHPSQLGNYLIAQYFFNFTRAAGFMPMENPNNAAIRAQFPGI